MKRTHRSLCACRRTQTALGRKTVHRGRLGFIRAAARPRAALQVTCGHATGGAPRRWLQSCAWAGCGANEAQAPAAGEAATQRGYESVRSARIEPGVRFMLANAV